MAAGGVLARRKPRREHLFAPLTGTDELGCEARRRVGDVLLDFMAATAGRTHPSRLLRAATLGSERAAPPAQPAALAPPFLMTDLRALTAGSGSSADAVELQLLELLVVVHVVASSGLALRPCRSCSSRRSRRPEKLREYLVGLGLGWVGGGVRG